MITRRKTRHIKVGTVRIGADAPISIQSMVKTETRNIKAVISEIKRLEESGCEIVRIAVKSPDDIGGLKTIKKAIKIPLVCDIHFNYMLALKAIENGADKIRLNPGNIRKADEITRIVKAAKARHIPIRIGVNSGSLSDDRPKDLSAGLVDSATRYIRLFEELDFHDIIISLKASDVVSTVDAYRDIAERCDYPLHLGVTAAGPYDSGIVKSSIGIGALLLEGIGDTIRVSLTGDGVDEVIAAKRILSSLNIRNFGPEIIACPTCGRAQADIVKIVRELERKLPAFDSHLSAKKPLRIAVMGCEVNGPGEAMDADIGIAAGKGAGMLFIKGERARRIKEKDFIKELFKELEKLCAGQKA